MNKSIFVIEDRGGQAAALSEALAAMVHVGADVVVRPGMLVELDAFYAPVVERLVELAGVEWRALSTDFGSGLSGSKDPSALRNETAGAWEPGPNEWVRPEGMAAEYTAAEYSAVVIDPGDPERGVGEVPAEIEQAEPVEVGDLRRCAHCGELFPVRHRKTRYCNAPECRKAQNREYQAKYKAKKDEALEEARAVTVGGGQPATGSSPFEGSRDPQPVLTSGEGSGQNGRPAVESPAAMRASR